VPYPWRAFVDRGSPQPAAFYVALIGRGIRSGRRARHRLGPLWRLAARAPLPESALARSLARAPGRANPELDELIAAVAGAWPRLAARARDLPSAAPRLGALVLERSAGLMIFLFGDRPSPLVVAKLGGGRVRREAAALCEADPVGIAPRYLGEVGGLRVQEGLEGEPLTVSPVPAEQAASLRWSREHAELATGLARLAGATAKPAFPDELRGPVERALAHERLGEPTRRRLAAAWRELGGMRSAVLRKRDAAAENCLFRDGRLAGLVDWERADPRGVPSFDLLDATIAYMEFCVALSRWSEQRAVTALAASWDGSDLWRGARTAARECALAGGVPERLLEPLEVAFFGFRLGRRLLGTGVVYPTGPAAAAAQLELVCRS
jgi:Phosphotransferase enzyme family